MKKFSRCVLILILVAILSGVGGYFFEDKTLVPMYESVAKLYVVPGESTEASIRTKDGSLNDDFMFIFKSESVLEVAKANAGTSEDLSSYLTVSSPANSNIIELKVVNPDQQTAKNYVDAIAKAAVNTTSIIPVESIKILSDGTSTGKMIKPDLYKNTAIIMALALAATLFIEILVCLFISAFKKKEEVYDDYDYGRRYESYNTYVRRKPELLEAKPAKAKRSSKKDDILESIDDEYGAEDVDSADVEDSLNEGEGTIHFEDVNGDDKAEKEAAATKESKVKIIGRIRK